MKNHLLSKLILSFIFLLFVGEISYSQCSEIIFRDEFNGTSVDQNKWKSITGDGCPTLCGFGNNEEQWYSPENTTVENGNLVITTKYESVGGKDFTSSKLVTSGKFNSKYGRYEASIKLPSAGGIWPAFWMLPENGDWPFTGEIDIMESKHKNPESIGGTVHYYNNGWRYNGREYDAGLDLSEGFHEYAVEWEPTEIRWYVDDQLYHVVNQSNTVDPWPFSQGDWYIILNVAVGGKKTPYTGNIAPTPADYPTQMEVDYVRVYNGTFNTELTGDNTVYEGETNKTYTITPTSGASYNWSTPTGATITSGQGTNTITVNWGTIGGDVSVTVNSSNCGVNDYKMNVSLAPQRVLDYMYEDFESNRNLTYGSSTSGDLTTAIANPGSDATNSSAVVGKYKRNSGSQYDVLFMESSAIGNALEFTSGKRTISIDIYSDVPIGTELIIQLENSTLSSGSWPSGRHSRYDAKTTTQNKWETLEFELIDTPDTSVGAFDVDQFTLLISANSYTDHTIYFDNVRSMSPPDSPILEEKIIANYDGVNQLNPIFINGEYTADVSNPASNTVNSSANVAKYRRNASEQYDVASFATSVIEDSKPFKDGESVFYMDIYTTAAIGTEITLSLENQASSSNSYPSGRNSQYKGIITEKNAWHTIAFTHASSPDTGTSNLAVDEISILFDPNSNSSDTYYFDNFRYGVTILPPTYRFSEMIQNYNGSNNLTFNSTTTGVYTPNVSNPSANSVNESSKAARYARNTDELYDVLFFNTDFITDVSAYVSEEKRFAMDIYTSAPIGTTISWQLEASTIANASNYPLGRHSIYQATVTQQNSWHTIEFVLTRTPDIVLSDAQIDTMTLLFSPNSDSGDIFYIDNLRSLSKENITVIPVLTSITVTADSTTIDRGQTAQFNAQGFDQNGALLESTFSWTATGGSINAEGLYTGSESGTFIITATSDSIASNVSIIVTPEIPVLTLITVTTDSTTIDRGQTAQFSAQGFDQNGAFLETTFNWTATGGTIDSEGLYTGLETGTNSITATNGSISGTISIAVQEDVVSYTEIPGIIEAEDYKEGGEGVGYYDTTMGNTGDAYREDNVDIQVTTGGYNIGWIRTGEWLAYDIKAIVASDTYSIDFLVSSRNGNGKFHLELDGVSITDIIQVPNTRGWQNYETVTVNDISIEKGSHELRVVFDENGLNLNSFQFFVTTEENSCTGIADNGQYSYAISLDPKNPTITYVPESTGMGENLCILYYGTSPTGPYPGYRVNPNEPYQINAKNGDAIYFYYTYSLPNGRENNTARSKHDFTVGSCLNRASTGADNITNDITIFPNPIQDKVSLSGLDNSYLINIYTIGGTLIMTENLHKKQDGLDINISSLPKGLYVIKIYNENKEPSIHKILKN